ncbi:MAG: hypothetical protein QXO40_02775 [Candidatus Aenigmatarchaeota archaeon]
MDKKVIEILRVFLGLMWIVAGILKIPLSFFEAENMIKSFSETCLIGFYSEIIKNYVLPNSFLVVLIIGILEILTGILILRSEFLVKIGFCIGIFLNIIFLPLANYTIPINLILIALQLFLLTKKFENSGTNILKDFILSLIKK